MRALNRADHPLKISNVNSTATVTALSTFKDNTTLLKPRDCAQRHATGPPLGHATPDRLHADLLLFLCSTFTWQWELSRRARR